MKLYIATSRPEEIGNRCMEWAKKERYELTSWLIDCDVFISVLYDELIDKEFIDRHRCYNFHPGILPDYRGSGAYSWALINGEVETGITLHEIKYNIDSGPIIEIRRTLIGEHDTAETLFVRCMDILFNMFRYWLPYIVSGEYVTQPNEGGKLYLRKDLELAKDISGLVKGLTFSGKESAYWFDSKGNKHYVEWQ